MIGNSLPRDVAGAKRAGMRAVWLNRQGDPPEGEAIPDAEIRSLDELPALLDSRFRV
jgi:putative hydrolase of the HAD superfamily